MRDKNVFNPKISNLNNINYYQNFILIDNNLFKKLSNDNGNKYDMHYNFEFQEPKEVNICFIENKFIYKLNHFSLGFGIVDQKNNYPLLNIDFIIILNKQSGYNYETEIKQLLIDKSIKNFFSSSRQIDFSSHDNNPKIIYDGTNNEIGKFYSLDNFLYENYFEINNYSNNSFEQPSIEENKFMNSNGNIKKGHINNSLINNTKCGNNVTRDRHNITNNNLSKYSTLNKKNNETEIIEENISIINESNRNFLNDIQEENISIKMSSNNKNGKLKMEINNFIDQKEKKQNKLSKNKNKFSLNSLKVSNKKDSQEVENIKINQNKKKKIKFKIIDNKEKSKEEDNNIKLKNNLRYREDIQIKNFRVNSDEEEEEENNDNTIKNNHRINIFYSNEIYNIIKKEYKEDNNELKLKKINEVKNQNLSDVNILNYKIDINNNQDKNDKTTENNNKSKNNKIIVNNRDQNVKMIENNKKKINSETIENNNKDKNNIIIENNKDENNKIIESKYSKKGININDESGIKDNNQRSDSNLSSKGYETDDNNINKKPINIFNYNNYKFNNQNEKNIFKKQSIIKNSIKIKHYNGIWISKKKE